MGLTLASEKLIGLFLCLVLLAGCAKKPLAREDRERLGRLGLTSVHYAPEMNISIASPGQSTTAGATGGAVAGTLAPLAAGPYAIPIVIFYWPILAATGATVGAAGGLAASYSSEEIKENVPLIEAYIFATEFQELLRHKVLDFTIQRTSQEFKQTDLKGSESHGHIKDYSNETQLDTILEVGISCINLAGPGLFGGYLTFHVEGFSRLVRVADGMRILENDYTYDSIARGLEEWSADGGKTLQEEIQNGFDVIASEIVDAHFIEKIKFRSNSASLKKILPDIDYCFFCKDNMEPLDTLTPQLSWQSFPTEEDLALPEFAWLRNVEDIVYDLQHIITNGGTLFTGLTGHYGIKQPSFRFEKPLEYYRTYAWRVRARFQVDGITYATPWKGYYLGYRFRTPSPKL